VPEAGIVAYDAGPAKSQPTGVGVYVRELARALMARAPGRIVLIGARADGPLAAEAATLMRGERHLVWLQRHAAADARRVGAAGAHYTNATAPLRPGMPYVLTIQDLSLIRYPHYHPVLRLAGVPFLVAAGLRAARIIVPSRATADEVMRLGVPARKLSVIELGPSGPVRTGADEVASVLERRGLRPQGYILSIATLEPRKNITRLVRAFELIAERSPGLRLVLAGGRGWRTGKILRRIERSPVRDRIVMTGFVSDAERAALLAGCAAFAYVSLYEGYGLPVVEAMAAGAPVVTSDISSLPEAAGGAGILVDPYDPRAIAAGLREGIERAAELSAAGRQRVSRLSWDRVATETLAVYDDALA
jgi:glycosyltransferase involved in cell wall biosynthesis